MAYDINLAKLAEQLNKDSVGMASLQENISGFQRLIDSITKSALEVPQSLIRVAESAQKVGLQMEKQLSAIYNSNLIQAIQKMTPSPEVIRIYRKTEVIIEAGEILSSLGWWIFPDMTSEDFEKYIKWHNEKNDGMIQDMLISYYDDTEKIIVEWENNPALKKRIRILKDVAWAHQTGKYTLSVPAILPQIEGIIVEGTGKTGYVSQGDVPDLAEKLLTQDKPLNLRHYFIITFIESLIKKHFEWGSPEGEFGRSPVLHGYFTDYDDREISIKLILLFDYLQKFLSLKNEPQ